MSMASSEEFALSDIRQRLAAHRPRILPAEEREQAAVAMILRTGPITMDVLFIIRATHEQDPWSGNIGFPGGRLNPGVESSRQAAERETLEELGIDLGSAEHVGRLNDLYGATLPILVSCHVYCLTQETLLRPNHEVARAFWYPLPQLLQSRLHESRTFTFHGTKRAYPVVKILQPEAPVLWGITYRLLADLFSLCGRPFAAEDAPAATTA